MRGPVPIEVVSPHRVAASSCRTGDPICVASVAVRPRCHQTAVIPVEPRSSDQPSLSTLRRAGESCARPRKRSSELLQEHQLVYPWKQAVESSAMRRRSRIPRQSPCAGEHNSMNDSDVNTFPDLDRHMRVVGVTSRADTALLSLLVSACAEDEEPHTGCYRALPEPEPRSQGSNLGHREALEVKDFPY